MCVPLAAFIPQLAHFRYNSSMISQFRARTPSPWLGFKKPLFLNNTDHSRPGGGEDLKGGS